MLFLMVFGRYPEKFSLGIPPPLQPDQPTGTSPNNSRAYLDDRYRSSADCMAAHLIIIYALPNLYAFSTHHP